MEFKSVSDWRAGPGLCRCCLSDGCYKDISNEYFWKGDKEVYADMLLDCFDLTISYQECGPNSNSRLICEVCIQRLRDAFSFKKQVVSSERRFSDYVKALASGEKPDLASFHEVKVELIKGEKAPSEPAEDDDMHNDLFDNLDDDDDDDADNQPLKNFASQLPKVESDTMQDIPAFDEDLIKKEAKVVKRKYTKKATSTSSKKAKPTTDDPEASSSKIKMDKKKGLTKIAKPILRVRASASKVREQAEQKRNAALILNNFNVCPFTFWHNRFRCVFCPEAFVEFAELRLHQTDLHIDASPWNIYRLARRFHIVKIDINDAECKRCTTKLSSIDEIIDHLISIHGEKIDKTMTGVIPFRIHDNADQICQLCNKVFPTFFRLREHMTSHDSNICEICGKRFASELHLYHHKNRHSDAKMPCDKCDLVFTTKNGLQYHKRKVHNKYHPNQCPYCLERFANYNTRVQHLKNVHNAKLQEYPCPVCGRSFITSSRRAEHVRRNHRPPSHGCPNCSHLFSSASGLKRHLTRRACYKT